MATREEYNKCMRPYMTGGGPDRKERFCIGAKICSGKADNKEKARAICLSEPPKEKTPKRRLSTKENINIPQLASCIVAEINIQEILPENFESELKSAFEKCTGFDPKKEYRKFFRKCMKDNSSGDIRKFQAEKRFCDTEWAKQNGG